MSKLIITDSLVERVAQSLYNRNAKLASKSYSSALLETKVRTLNSLMSVQPGVVAFFLAGTVALGDESKSVGLFLSEVIFDTFRLAGRPSRHIDADKYIAALEANREIARQTEIMAHTKFAQQYLKNSGTVHQPALMRYVVGVLCIGHKTCPHSLPHNELGRLNIVLKSIVDVLDQDSEVPTGVN